MEKENVIKNKSFVFAIEIVSLYKVLAERKEFILSKQLLRSGTSIGANIRESEHAQSKADFIHKLSIALKEANETEYWLDLLYETKYVSESEFQSIKPKVIEILKILVSIINTSKRKIIINYSFSIVN
jgi:four helix bundle protein